MHSFSSIYTCTQWFINFFARFDEPNVKQKSVVSHLQEWVEHYYFVRVFAIFVKFVTLQRAPCRHLILILPSGKPTISTSFKIFQWISLWRHLWRSHISSTLINSAPRKTVSLKFLATFNTIMHGRIRKIKKNSFIFAGGWDQKLIDALTNLRIQTVLLTRLFNPLRNLN